MDISDWRAKIDVIDEILVDLLSQRAQYALEIGKIKKARGMKVHAPERERWLLQKVQDLNKGPLSDQAIRRLFERIIDESRSLEREASERDAASS